MPCHMYTHVEEHFTHSDKGASDKDALLQRNLLSVTFHRNALKESTMFTGILPP